MPTSTSGPTPSFRKIVRQPVGAFVQFTVGQLLLFEYHRETVGRLLYLRFEQFVDAPMRIVRVVRFSRVPLHQQLLLLVRAEHRQVLDARPGIGDDGLQQTCEVPGHAFDRGSVEQIGVVFEGGAAVGSLLSATLSVRSNLAAPPSVGTGSRGQTGQAADGSCGGRILQCQHDLEERRMAGVALRLERLHQLLEGHILVGIGIQGGGAHLLRAGSRKLAVLSICVRSTSVLTKKPISASISARLRLAIGRADADVALTGVARQQDVEGGGERHEQGGLRLFVQGMQSGVVSAGISNDSMAP